MIAKSFVGTFRRAYFGPLLVALSALLLPLGNVVPAEPDTVDKSFDPDPVVALLELVIDVDHTTAGNCLRVLASKVQAREISPPQIEALKRRLDRSLGDLIAQGSDSPLYFDALILAASWKRAGAVQKARAACRSKVESDQSRISLLTALISIDDDDALSVAAQMLHPSGGLRESSRGALLATLGGSSRAEVAPLVLAVYPQLPPEQRPQAIELLTQRPAWAKALLSAIADQQIPANVLNANQVSRLLATGDEALHEMIQSAWGTVRTKRNPDRERVVAQMKLLLQRQPGDPHRGEVVFHKVCGQCHKIHGKGHDVGPDLTGNGRASFDQLLSNVFDPSLVIGAAYQARTVVTDDGRVLSGLLVEDNAQRIVLKMQGGKQTVVPRDEIDEMHVGQLSLMPEGLEKQLQPEELADLFSFITLDGPPSNSESRRIPGSPSFRSAN